MAAIKEQMEAPSAEFETVNCALCGGTIYQEVCQTRDYRHHLPGFFHIVRCSDCGLIFLNPRPRPDSLSSLYPENYGPHNETELSPERRRYFARRIEMMERWLGPLTGKRVLDVGCATGAFLHLLQETGVTVKGVDLSSRAAEAAGRRYGLQVQVSDCASADLPPSEYDAITMWHVLEHSYDPIGCLANLRKTLRPDGLLLVEVPNTDGFLLALFRGRFGALQPPLHLYHFTAASLAQCLSKAGFKSVEQLSWPTSWSFTQSVANWLRGGNNRAAGDQTKRRASQQSEGLNRRDAVKSFGITVVDGIGRTLARLGHSGTLLMIARK